jgi:FMN phosphatase YigB (HAD superfamily)
MGSEPVSSALLFDLGETLIHDGAVLPGVFAMLDLARSLTLATGEPLPLGLVSDYTEPVHGDDEAERQALFEEYLGIVRGLELLAYFSPPEQHVTLSFQAGARKPDARVFVYALQRLGCEPVLDRCVYVTEDAGHVAACRALGMRALRFGPGGDIRGRRCSTLA